MLVSAILITLILNILYLYSVRSLMDMLKRRANPYWEHIGRPDSFSANHGMGILSNLYTEKMSGECLNSGLGALLRRVRVLLPLTFVITGTLILVLSVALKTS